MCTSIIFSPKDHYFGRNLDLEISFGQKVVITPRNYVFNFRKMPAIKKHYAMIGIAITPKDYPLYFDAVNEAGLGMAGLNYPDNAVYHDVQENKDNISPFELIPWILSQCQTVAEAKQLLAKINLVNINFDKDYQLSPLHWLIADKTGQSLVLESDQDGLHLYDNPVGALTNNPSFPKQLFSLNNYATVSPQMPKNTIVPGLKLGKYSRGLGSRHLPGGMDSQSRFIRACFNKSHAPTSTDEAENVNTYFHILHAVEQQKGLDQVGPNSFEYTIYSDGTNLEKGIFYYTTYNKRQITRIDMHKENLDGDALISYPIDDKVSFINEN